jgi:hypothetical protein
MSKLTLALVLSAAAASGFYLDRWLHRPIVVETRCLHGVSLESVPAQPVLHPYISAEDGSCELPWNLCQKTA